MWLIKYKIKSEVSYQRLLAYFYWYPTEWSPHMQKVGKRFGFFSTFHLFYLRNFSCVWKIGAQEEEGVIQFVCFPKTNDSGLRAAWWAVQLCGVPVRLLSAELLFFRGPFFFSIKHPSLCLSTICFILTLLGNCWRMEWSCLLIV